ncbi:hypothetical protein D3C81_1263340 [compost metagenome]
MANGSGADSARPAGGVVACRRQALPGSIHTSVRVAPAGTRSRATPVKAQRRNVAASARAGAPASAAASQSCSAGSVKPGASCRKVRQNGSRHTRSPRWPAAIASASSAARSGTLPPPAGGAGSALVQPPSHRSHRSCRAGSSHARPPNGASSCSAAASGGVGARSCCACLACAASDAIAARTGCGVVASSSSQSASVAKAGILSITPCVAIRASAPAAMSSGIDSKAASQHSAPMPADCAAPPCASSHSANSGGATRPGDA